MDIRRSPAKIKHGKVARRSSFYYSDSDFLPVFFLNTLSVRIQGHDSIKGLVSLTAMRS